MTLAPWTSLLSLLVWSLPAFAESRVPLTCNHGSDVEYVGRIKMPVTAKSGATIVVRIDGVASGKISHTGLNYIHDMVTDFVFSPTAKYVEGSARIVALTGTRNTRSSARVSVEGNGVRLSLPARVKNGRGYTAPSVVFELQVADGDVQVQLAHYALKANAIIVGDVQTDCEPDPKPFLLATTTIK